MKTKWRKRTGDTNVTPSKGKQRNKVAEIGLRPAGAVGDSFKKYRKESQGMKKYDLSHIMTKAWKIFRKAKVTFAEALHRAWLSAKAEEINQKRIENARSAAGVTEEVNTWSGWKALGYEVIHGCKALFGTELIWGSKGDGAMYKARFFGRSQVQEIVA